MKRKNYPTLKEIAKDWLAKNGYDGLWDEQECGCTLKGFMPCDEPHLGCTAGYELELTEEDKEEGYDVKIGKRGNRS